MKKFIYFSAPWNDQRFAIGCNNDELYAGATDLTSEIYTKEAQHAIQHGCYVGINVCEITEEDLEYLLTEIYWEPKAICSLRDFCKKDD